MSGVLIISVFMEKAKMKAERINRRKLRDCSNPLELPEQSFIAYFRLNKDTFRMVLEEISPIANNTSIPTILQLATALRYFGQGSAQQMIGKDSNLALGRSTVSKVITRMCNVLESTLCPKWIKFDRSSEELLQSKRHFYDKFRLPGIIGCIDGTHVKIKAPAKDSHLFYNRKGYFSLNAMIICDHLMNIIAVNACRPGACHDSFIWKLSDERQYLMTNYNNGARRSWLLGDGGYSLEPFLLTPYRCPQINTPEHLFNKKHASARNIVERVIGVLKSRFRCLLDTISYEPRKAVQIINVCCALHNICKSYHVSDPDCNDFVVEEITEETTSGDSEANDLRLLNDAVRIRNEITRNII